MIMKYIEKPNTLILAITPANTDFATSEAVKLARMVDPEGQRRVLKFCESYNYFCCCYLIHSKIYKCKFLSDCIGILNLYFRLIFQ